MGAFGGKIIAVGWVRGGGHGGYDAHPGGSLNSPATICAF